MQREGFGEVDGHSIKGLRKTMENPTQEDKWPFSYMTGYELREQDL
jgi:hypothetical protein